MTIFTPDVARARALVLALFFTYGAQTSAAEQTLPFDVVSQFDVRGIHSIWQPVLDDLKKQSGIYFELVGSDSSTAFEKQLRSGDFDFASMSPYQQIGLDRNYIQ